VAGEPWPSILQPQFLFAAGGAGSGSGGVALAGGPEDVVEQTELGEERLGAKRQEQKVISYVGGRYDAVAVSFVPPSLPPFPPSHLLSLLLGGQHPVLFNPPPLLLNLEPVFELEFNEPPNDPGKVQGYYGGD